MVQMKTPKIIVTEMSRYFELLQQIMATCCTPVLSACSCNACDLRIDTLTSKVWILFKKCISPREAVKSTDIDHAHTLSTTSIMWTKPRTSSSFKLSKRRMIEALEVCRAYGGLTTCSRNGSPWKIHITKPSSVNFVSENFLKKLAAEHNVRARFG